MNNQFPMGSKRTFSSFVSNIEEQPSKKLKQDHSHSDYENKFHSLYSSLQKIDSSQIPSSYSRLQAIAKKLHPDQLPRELEEKLKLVKAVVETPFLQFSFAPKSEKEQKLVVPTHHLAFYSPVIQKMMLWPEKEKSMERRLENFSKKVVKQSIKFLSTGDSEILKYSDLFHLHALADYWELNALTKATEIRIHNHIQKLEINDDEDNAEIHNLLSNVLNDKHEKFKQMIESKISSFFNCQFTSNSDFLLLRNRIDLLDRSISPNPIFLNLKNSNLNNFELMLFRNLSLRGLNLSFCNITENALPLLCGMISENDKFSKLNISKNPILNFTSCQFDRLENLTDLNLSNNNFSDEDLLKLPLTLEKLNLSNTRIGGNDVCSEHFTRMKRLKKLNLSNNSLTSSTVSQLPLSLQKLNLSSCDVDDSCRYTLMLMKDLISLQLENCIKISDLTINDLPPSIKILNLFKCNVTDASSEKLSSLSSLQDLNLSLTAISDETIKKLPHSLIKLKLRSCTITDESSPVFAKMSQLKWLDLNSTFISDVTVIELPLGFETLALGECNITDNIGPKLNQMKNLKFLELWKTNISDDTVELLPSTLNILDLYKCPRIGLRSISVIANMKEITFIQLEECQGIKDEWLTELMPPDLI